MQPAESGRRPTLKLFDDGGQISSAAVSPKDSLSIFLRDYYVPVDLVPDGCHDGTITSYDESMQWWCQGTGDPPMESIDEFTWAQFRKFLQEVKWSRGPSGKPKQLSSPTRHKHEKQIRRVIDAAGRKGFVNLPEAKVSRPQRALAKPSFPPQAVLAIAAATARMPRPQEAEAWVVPWRKWWFAAIAMLFYTGLRTGTTFRLRYSLLVEYDQESGRYPGWYVQVPGEIVPKTGKPLEKFVHPVALAAVNDIRTSGRDLIFAVKRSPKRLELPHCPRHLIDRHECLQREAGLKKVLDFQAWRRTHATEMAKLGANYAREVAQRALDHADVRTTSQFYLDTESIEAQLIAQLPELVRPPEGPVQLGLF